MLFCITVYGIYRIYIEMKTLKRPLDFYDDFAYSHHTIDT